MHEAYVKRKKRMRAGGCFSKVPVANRPGKLFCVCCITLSIILTIIQWNHQLRKQNGLVCELGTVQCYYSTSFDFKICTRARKLSGPFEKPGPRLRLVLTLVLIGYERERNTTTVVLYLCFFLTYFYLKWTRWFFKETRSILHIALKSEL